MFFIKLNEIKANLYIQRQINERDFNYCYSVTSYLGKVSSFILAALNGEFPGFVPYRLH